MKTIHFASILVLASTVTFACGDDDDDTTPGTAGSSGAAGKNGTAGSSTAGKNGTAGSGTAGTGGKNTAGTGGSKTDAGEGGVAGETQGGAGGLGGAGGEGGAPFVCPPLGLGGAGGEFSVGGAGGEGGGNSAGLEIVGKWNNNFGGKETIREDRWTSFGTAAIVEYDNDANVVYTESDCTFSKVVDTEIQGDSFYSCTIAYGLPTLAGAKADTKVANPATPDTSGCGAFSWTKLTRL